MKKWSLLCIFWFGCSSNTPTTIAPIDTYAPKNDARAKVRHILLGFEGAWRSSSRRTKEDALAQIGRYREQITQGTPFGELAQQFSEDPQKKEKGLVGVIGRGEMLEAFEEAAFSLQINELSGVVETGFGYHLIQRLPLDERKLIHIEVDQESIANTIHTELNSGANPMALAQTHSIAPHGIRGGNLGWFEKMDLDTLFVDPVFALAIGTCTPAIQRESQWHFFCRQE